MSKGRLSTEVLGIPAKDNGGSKEKLEEPKNDIKEIIKKRMNQDCSKNNCAKKKKLSSSHILSNEKRMKTPAPNRGALYLHKSTEFFKIKNAKKKIGSLKKDLKFESCETIETMQDKLKSKSTKNIHISSFEVFESKISCRLGKSASYFKGIKEKKKIKIKPTAKKVKTEKSWMYLKKKGSMSSPFKRRKKQFLKNDKGNKKRVNQPSYESSPVRVKKVLKPCSPSESNKSCKNLGKMIESIYKESKPYLESRYFKGKEDKSNKDFKMLINNCSCSRENLSYSINLTKSLKIAKQGFFGKDRRKSPNDRKNSKVVDMNTLRKSRKKFENKGKEKNLRIKKKRRRDKKKIARKHRLSKVSDNLIRSQNINSSIGKQTNKSKGCSDLRGSHFVTHVSQGRRASNMKKNYKEMIKMMKRTTKRRKDNQSSSRKANIRSTFFSPTIQMLTRTRNLSSKAKEQIKLILKEKKDPRNKKSELLDIIRKYTTKKKSGNNMSKHCGVSETGFSKSMRRKTTVDEYDLGSTELNSQHETQIMNSEIFKTSNFADAKVHSDNESQKENNSQAMSDKPSLFGNKKSKRRNTYRYEGTLGIKSSEAQIFEGAINSG